MRARLEVGFAGVCDLEFFCFNTREMKFKNKLFDDCVANAENPTSQNSSRTRISSEASTSL